MVLTSMNDSDKENYDARINQKYPPKIYGGPLPRNIVVNSAQSDKFDPEIYGGPLPRNIVVNSRCSDNNPDFHADSLPRYTLDLIAIEE